jgi:hypothetical protein
MHILLAVPLVFPQIKVNNSPLELIQVMKCTLRIDHFRLIGAQFVSEHKANVKNFP